MAINAIDIYYEKNAAHVRTLSRKFVCPSDCKDYIISKFDYNAYM